MADGFTVNGVVDVAAFRAQRNTVGAAMVRLSPAGAPVPLDVLVSLDNTSQLLASDAIPDWLIDTVLEMQEEVRAAAIEKREFKIDGRGMKRFTKMVDVIAAAIFIQPKYVPLDQVQKGALPPDALCIRDLDDYAQGAVVRLFNDGIEGLKRYHQEQGADIRADSGALRPTSERASVSESTPVDSGAIRSSDSLSVEPGGQSDVRGARTKRANASQSGSAPEFEHKRARPARYA